MATPDMFVDNTNAVSIYVACNGGRPLGGEHIAKRAIGMVNRSREYSFLTDNCHQFSAGCVTGDFENSNNYFFLLENVIAKEMNGGGSIEWRVWNVSI